MSTHEWRVERRRAASEARSKESPWYKMCHDAGFTDDEMGGVTIKMLHERLYGPVKGPSLIDIMATYDPEGAEKAREHMRRAR